MVIYIVEDDENIRQLESYALRGSGYETEEFADVGGFFERCAAQRPALVVLDVMLPGEDGLSILRRLREDQSLRAVPVIMVTAKTSEMDAVRGLDGGADDYLTKPFGIMEFLSRVRAALRRAAPGEPSQVLRLGAIALDEDKRLVTAGGAPCELTFKEFELLRFLLRNAGIVMTRGKLMDSVWGTDYEGETRTVDVHVKTLRQKLGDAGAQIKTVRNVGYKIERE